MKKLKRINLAQLSKVEQDMKEREMITLKGKGECVCVCAGNILPYADYPVSQNANTAY